MTEYLSRKEACEYLGIHYLTLYKLAKTGEIKSKKIGGQTKYILNDYKITTNDKINLDRKKNMLL